MPSFIDPAYSILIYNFSIIKFQQILQLVAGGDSVLWPATEFYIGIEWLGGGYLATNSIVTSSANTCWSFGKGFRDISLLPPQSSVFLNAGPTLVHFSYTRVCSNIGTITTITLLLVFHSFMCHCRYHQIDISIPSMLQFALIISLTVIRTR